MWPIHHPVAETLQTRRAAEVEQFVVRDEIHPQERTTCTGPARRVP
jgi:hypothetical protein